MTVAPVELEAHLMWYQAYYQFSRPHESLRLTHPLTNTKGEEVVRYRNPAPAMEAGLMRRRLPVRELQLRLLPASG